MTLIAFACISNGCPFAGDGTIVPVYLKAERFGGFDVNTRLKEMPCDRDAAKKRDEVAPIHGFPGRASHHIISLNETGLVHHSKFGR